MILGVDLETCSAADLKAVGAWNYALHPSTRVHCAVLGLANLAGEYRMHRWVPGQDLPPWAVAHIRAGGPVLAHNATFERQLIKHVLAPMCGWPEPAPDQWHDTLAMAAAVNLPQSLQGLASVFGGAAKKDKEGADLMRSVMHAKPDGAGGWAYPVLNTDTLKRLLDYCEADVRAMFDVYFRLPALGVVESEVLRVDREINERGVYLDRGLAAAMGRVVNARKDVLGLDAFEASAFELEDALGTPAVKAWLAKQDITLPTVLRTRKDGTRVATPTVDRATVFKLLGEPGLPPRVRRVLESRAEASKATSLAKLHRVAQLVGPDGRLRHSLHYCAAGTGRWASRGLQIHNLPRNKLGSDLTRYALRCVREEDLGGLALMWERPLDVLSSLLRSVIAAPAGREIIGGDYSAIEARVVAWLAGQQDVLDLFARGEDVYVAAAKKIGSDNRQLGKVCVLALGYGMGVVKFLQTAGLAGIDLRPKEARAIQRAWREANAAIVQFWLDLERAVRDCLADPSRTIRVGLVTVCATSASFIIQLPSGRRLYYWRPRVVNVEKTFETIDENGELVVETRTMEEVQYFRPGGVGMEIDSAYGGKLVENVTQAVARDLLAETLVRLSGTRYEVVTHVHDSIASEVDTGTGDVDEFTALMTASPDWASGLPLKAEGYRSRFFKG